MAAAGVPMRTLQECMGHRDICDDGTLLRLLPHTREAEMMAVAFARKAHGTTARMAVSA
jgi:hypothetical protein